MVNYKLKALLIEIVDNQINDNNPQCTKDGEFLTNEQQNDKKFLKLVQS